MSKVDLDIFDNLLMWGTLIPVRLQHVGGKVTESITFTIPPAAI